TSRGPIARRVRVNVVPVVVPLVFRLRAARRLMFRTISQTGVSYRGSRLSVGRAGRVHGGDRLPWVEGADNFAPLRSLAWQVHVFPWWPEIRRTGLRRNALYLVRPDGYVALADPDARASTLARYLAERLATRQS